jgi:hypothetical protein
LHSRNPLLAINGCNGFSILGPSLWRWASLCSSEVGLYFVEFGSTYNKKEQKLKMKVTTNDFLTNIPNICTRNLAHAAELSESTTKKAEDNTTLIFII